MAAAKKRASSASSVKPRRKVWVKAHTRKRPQKAWQKATKSAQDWGF